MARDIQFQIQAEAQVTAEIPITGREIYDNWKKFDTNVASSSGLGLWEVNANGDLVLTSNQDGFSGRYLDLAISLTNYTFSARITPAVGDNGSWGVHFRYQDVFNFYFFVWDHKYRSLFLYKMQNGQLKQLRSKSNVMWVAGQEYEMKVELSGAHIKCYVDGILIFDHTDANAPLLHGAYGPIGYSQPDTRWHQFTGETVIPFTVTRDFTGMVPESSTSNVNPTQLTAEPVGTLMASAVAHYCVANGYNPDLAQVKRYTISTSTPGMRVYFVPATMAAVTSDGTNYPYAHYEIQLTVPAAPSNLIGTLQSNNTEILWRWKDNSDNETGFRVLDRYGNILAVLLPNTVSWLETNVPPNTEVCRQVVAYNASGVSASSGLVCVKTPEVLPDAPSLMTGVATSHSDILWTWQDNAKNEKGYRIYSETGVLLATLPSDTTSWLETGLEEQTIYIRRVVAYNDAGESAPAEGVCTTLAKPAPIPQPPAPPFNLFGHPISDTVIEWQWEMQDACDGFKLVDENGQLIAVVDATQRVYRETGLYPGTTYLRRVIAFNQDGDSIPSDLASATTLDEQVPDDYVCHVIDTVREGERLRAFQSGVGDGMDLKVKRPARTAPEHFTYEAQLIGEIPEDLPVYDQVKFNLRYRAEGEQITPFHDGEFKGILGVYPGRKYDVTVRAFAQVPQEFHWQAHADLEYVTDYDIPVDQFAWTAEAHGLRLFPSDQDLQQVFDQWVRFGDGQWEYDSASGILRNNFNSTQFTGFYDPNQRNRVNYSVSCDIRVNQAKSGNDNDGIGLLFRLQDSQNYYYVLWAKDTGYYIAGWSGPELFRLMKMVNGTPVEIAKADIPGWQYDTWYHLNVDVVGNTIKVSLNGNLILQAQDSTFSAGAFGPISFSQSGSEYRNLRATDSQPVVITSPPQFAEVTAHNQDTATAKQLITQSLREFMEPIIANYKLVNGIPDDQLRIDSYTVSDNSDTVTVYTPNPDGSGAVFAYTSKQPIPIWEPHTLSTNPIQDTVVEADTQASPKLLSPSTVEQLLAGIVNSFRQSQGLQPHEIRILNYYLTHDNPNVEIWCQSDGKDQPKARCLVITDWIDEARAQGQVWKSDGTVQILDARLLQPVDRDGNPVPAGIPITYSIHTQGTDTGVTVRWADRSDSNDRTTPAAVVVSSNLGEETQLDLSAQQTPETIQPDSLLNPPADWTDLRYLIRKTGGTHNTYAYWEANPGIRVVDIGDEVIIQGSNPTLIYGAGIRYERTPWSGYSDWYTVTVNGRKPYMNAGDGRQPLYLPVDMPLPTNVDPDSVRYWIEIDDQSIQPEAARGTVTYTWKRSGGPYTTYPDDLAVVTSSYMATVTRTRYWRGVRIQGKAATVGPDETLVINELIPNPRQDANWNDLPVKPVEYRLTILSHNPNVRVTLAEVPSDWTPASGDPIPVQLQATQINPTQGAWHPLIHTGFYYLNNEEFYLYSDDQVRGKAQHDVHQRLDLSYSVEADVVERLPAGPQTFIHGLAAPDTADDVQGFSKDSGTGLEIKDGKLTLIPDAPSGEYYGQTLEFNRPADPAKPWGPLVITYAPESPQGSGVEIMTRSLNNGVWSAWEPVDPATNTPVSPPGTRLAYRLILHSVEERIPYQDPQYTFIHADADLISESSNIKLENGKATLADPTQPGWLYGPVMDLDDPKRIHSLGSLMATMTVPPGAKLKFYTISADSPYGPWDGTAQPLMPVAPDGRIQSQPLRYLRWYALLQAGTASPELERVEVTPFLYRISRKPPVIESIAGSAYLPYMEIRERVRVELQNELVANGQLQPISSVTAAELVRQRLVEEGRWKGQDLENFTASTTEPDVTIEVPTDGQGPVMAMKPETFISDPTQRWVVVEEVDGQKVADVSPIPQQGAPIVVYDSLGPLRQVHFVDDQGRPTLDTYELFTDGGRMFALRYLVSRLDNVKVEVDWNRNGTWYELNGWTFCNHQLRLPIEIPPGTPVRVSYRLKRSFVVDYDWNEELNFARLIFHGVEPLSNNQIRVFYETSYDSAYKTATEVALNPLKNPITSGYIYLTDQKPGVDRLILHVNLPYILANGYEQATIFAQAIDSFGNPVPDVDVTITCDQTIVRQSKRRTDSNGMVMATLIAPTRSTNLVIRASDGYSEVQTVLPAISESENADFSLVASDLVLEGRTVEITARILNQSQTYEVGLPVLFELLNYDGILTRVPTDSVGTRSLTVLTNPNGTATVYLKEGPSGADAPADNLIRVRASIFHEGRRIFQHLLIRLKEV